MEMTKEERDQALKAVCDEITLAAFMAWVERYVAEEKARLNTDKAVSYCDEWAKHASSIPSR